MLINYIKKLVIKHKKIDYVIKNAKNICKLHTYTDEFKVQQFHKNITEFDNSRYEFEIHLYLFFNRN